MNTQEHNILRQRLKALLAIPDSQRTEAQWEEINELEISLAPGNRQDIPPGGGRRKDQGQGGQPKAGGVGGQGKRPHKRFHKKPPKANPT